MAGSLARAGAQRVCGWLYLADVAASSQSEEAGTHTLSVLVPALWHAGDTGPRLQPGVRPRLALALYRGERHCRSTPSSAQRLCGHRALDASAPFSDLEDAWRDEWSGLVVALLQHVPLAHTLPITLFASLWVVHLLITLIWAVPTLPRQRHVATDEQQLSAIFTRFERLQTVRVVIDVLIFGTTLWALVSYVS